jgi:hypothetical protein
MPMLAVAGTLAIVASSRRRASSAPPDTSRCAWAVPDPIRRDVIRRAQEIQAIGAPLGTEYVEELAGRIFKFRREMHGPNKEVPFWHPGVGVRLCELATKGALRA